MPTASLQIICVRAQRHWQGKVHWIFQSKYISLFYSNGFRANNEIIFKSTSKQNFVTKDSQFGNEISCVALFLAIDIINCLIKLGCKVAMCPKLMLHNWSHASITFSLTFLTSSVSLKSAKLTTQLHDVCNIVACHYGLGTLDGTDCTKQTKRCAQNKPKGVRCTGFV